MSVIVVSSTVPDGWKVAVSPFIILVSTGPVAFVGSNFSQSVGAEAGICVYIAVAERKLEFG